jgi:26S proteasome regulatory subunit N10
MPLEATMVVIDNSDFTRNGDYTPSRFTAQSDAVQMVCNTKTNANIENCVGLLSSAGDRVEVLLTPTDDTGRMTAELAKVKIGGTSDVLRGIQTAQLALKHRQNKNQKQRIVVFVASPVTASEKELETLGKNLKKNNVSLDLVSFGEVDENKPKLEKLLNAVNSSDTSHLVAIPVGPGMISDVLISSPIISDGESIPMGGGGGGGDGFDFGVDANADPELALALRISMEEERARQQQTEGGAQQPPAETTPAPTTEGATTQPAPAPSVTPAPEPMATNADIMAAMDDEDMDEELRQALLLSMQESGPPAETPPAPATTEAPVTEAPKATEPEKAPEKPEAPKDAEMTDATSKAEPPAEAPPTDGVGLDNKWFQDPDFVSELRGSLPGVDVNDPRIQEALAAVGDSSSTGEEKKDEKEEEKK